MPVRVTVPEIVLPESSAPAVEPETVSGPMVVLAPQAGEMSSPPSPITTAPVLPETLTRPDTCAAQMRRPVLPLELMVPVTLPPEMARAPPGLTPIGAANEVLVATRDPPRPIFTGPRTIAEPRQVGPSTTRPAGKTPVAVVAQPIIWVKVAEEARKSLLPPEDAVTEIDPGGRAEVERLAVPAVRGTTPRVVPLAVKVTLPPGVPAVAARALTLAVKVTVDPKADGEADETRVVVVGAWVTITDSPASLHAPETGWFCASPE